MNGKETLIIESELYNLDEIIDVLLDEYNTEEYQDVVIEEHRGKVIVITEEEDFLVVTSEVTQVLFYNGITHFTLTRGCVKID